VTGLDSNIDQENGQALGIYFVKFNLHEEAKRCVEKENGRRGGIPGGIQRAGEVEEWRVVYDGEGLKLKSVLKELEERKRREKDEKKKGFHHLNGATPSASGSNTAGNAGTPMSGFSSPAPGRKPGYPSSLPRRPNGNPELLPSRPAVTMVDSGPKFDQKEVPAAAPTDNFFDRLRQAREEAEKKVQQAATGSSSTGAPTSTSTTSRGKNVLQTTKYAPVDAYVSRSPSPSPDASDSRNALPAPPKSAADREKARLEVTKELARNGHDHVKVQGGVQLVATAREEDVRDFFVGFAVDKVSSLPRYSAFVAFASSSLSMLK